VLHLKGDAVTLRVDNGQVVLLSVGDTHGKHYDEFKYVETGVVISGTDTCTIEFYPHQKFIDLRTDDSPVSRIQYCIVLICSHRLFSPPFYTINTKFTCRWVPLCSFYSARCCSSYTTCPCATQPSAPRSCWRPSGASCASSGTPPTHPPLTIHLKYTHIKPTTLT
jgi:hypothetical protein